MNIKWNKSKSLGKIAVNGTEHEFSIKKGKGRISYDLKLNSLHISSNSDKEVLEVLAQDLVHSL